MDFDYIKEQALRGRTTTIICRDEGERRALDKELHEPGIQLMTASTWDWHTPTGKMVLVTQAAQNLMMDKFPSKWSDLLTAMDVKRRA